MILPLADDRRARGALILGRLPDTTRFDEMDPQDGRRFRRAGGDRPRAAGIAPDPGRRRPDAGSGTDRRRSARPGHPRPLRCRDGYAVDDGLPGQPTSAEGSARLPCRNHRHDHQEHPDPDLPAAPEPGRHWRTEGGDPRPRVRHTAQLGFSPTVRFVGPLDTAVDDTLAEDILAVVGEATSNCARHAHATRVAITAELAEKLTIEVVDNGRGISTPDHLSGLENLRRRAEKHHGTLDVTTPDSGGTRLLWTAQNVPVAHPRLLLSSRASGFTTSSRPSSTPSSSSRERLLPDSRHRVFLRSRRVTPARRRRRVWGGGW